jgi:tetratricopeptide (TPR) repeat protein
MLESAKLRFVLLVIAGTQLGFAGPLMAAGGGGGGGGEIPSQSDPQYDPVAEFSAGTVAMQARNFAEAKRRFDHVLTVNPRDAQTNYLAGMARVGLSDAKGAVRYFEKAVKADGAMISAHKQLGLAYAAIGKPDKAQAELDALKAKTALCAATCPDSASLQDAITALTSALAGTPQASVNVSASLVFFSASEGDHAYLEAVGLINQHRYESAIISLNRAQRSFGAHPDILTYLGFANRKLKNYDLAETYYRQALAIAPHHRGATEYYGELMVERGDLAGARRKLAALDAICSFGCYEAEELRHWIASGHGSQS